MNTFTLLKTVDHYGRGVASYGTISASDSLAMTDVAGIESKAADLGIISAVNEVDDASNKFLVSSLKATGHIGHDGQYRPIDHGGNSIGQICAEIRAGHGHLVFYANGRVEMFDAAGRVLIREIEMFYSGRQQGKTGMPVAKSYANIAVVRNSVFWIRYRGPALIRYEPPSKENDPITEPKIIREGIAEIASSSTLDYLVGLDKKNAKICKMDCNGEIVAKAKYGVGAKCKVVQSTLAASRKWVVVAKQIQTKSQAYKSYLELLNSKLTSVNIRRFKDYNERCTGLAISETEKGSWLLYAVASCKLVLFRITSAGLVPTRHFDGSQGNLLTLICGIKELKSESGFIVTGQSKDVPANTQRGLFKPYDKNYDYIL